MILIFPWAKMLPDGKHSPKDYPFWPAVVSKLDNTVQVSQKGEPDIGCSQRMDNLPLSDVSRLILECDTWVSVDSFAQHLGWVLQEPGIVLFGPSDPRIFGHPENCNLLLDRKHLREKQFNWWIQDTWKPEIFVPPEQVVQAVLSQMSSLAKSVS